MIPWWPIALSFFGALVVALGAWFAAQGWPRYVIVGGSVLVALGGLWFAIDQRSYQTGGDSYAYLIPSFTTTPRTDIVTVSLWHRGGYPLYDLSIRVIDLEKLHEHFAQHPTGALPPGQHTQQYSLPRLEPETAAWGFITWRLPRDRDEQGYNIGIVSARNMKRGVFQQLRFRRMDGEWRIARRDIRDDRVLFQDGEQYLPRDEKGQPIWEQGTGRWAR